MEDEKDELQLELTAELEARIKADVARIRMSDATIKAVFPIVVEGAEYDAKDIYVGYFRQPSFKSFSKYLSGSQKDQAVAMRQLARECFIEGDKELVDDESLFMFGLMGQLAKIIEMRNGRLVNLSKLGK